MAINDPLGLVGFFNNSGGGGGGSTAAKDLNYQQDLLSYLMSPNTGMGTGTYDPMIAVPPEYIPPATTILDSFENSSTPVMQGVARKIRAKLIDPANAVAEIATTLGITDTVSKNGMDMKSIRDAVASMFDEVTSVTDAENKHTASIKDWETTNQYGKGGFSQPYEQYAIDTLPFSSTVQDQQTQLDWLRRGSEMDRESSAPKSEAQRQALYAKMLKDNASALDISNIPGTAGGGIPKSIEEAEALAKTINVPEEFMRSVYNDTLGLETVTDAKGGRPFVRVPSAAEKEEAFRGLVSKNGVQDRGSGIISNYDKLEKYLMDTKATGADLDQAGRRGIALSYKAAEQTRYTDPNEEKRKKLERSLLINKMAELAAAKYQGRTPFSDQMAGRASTV